MKPARARTILVAAALTLSLTGTVLARHAAPAPAAFSGAVSAVAPFAVAALLAGQSPEVVVVALDAPVRHPLRGALPEALFGADDDAFVERAPATREVILAGVDPLRMDRLARRLIAKGRRVRMLEGGIAAWELTMDADPPAPPTNAPETAWKTYRTRVALRRSFGDAVAAPVAPIAAPAPALAAPGAGAKKREGC